MKLINTLYLMLILVLVGTSTMNAQNIILGTGTAVNTTTTAGPINIFYRSLRHQTVYTAAELQAAGAAPGQILQIGWYVTQVPLYDMPSYSIKMKHTTAVDAAAHDGVGLTQVYNDPLYAPTAGGWDMLTLQTPFVWNGVDNILVDVCFDLTNPTWSASGQARTYVAPTGSRYIRSDATNQCGANTTATLNEKAQVNFFIQSGPPPSCSMIESGTLVANNVLANTATLAWDSTNTPQYFLIEYGITGFLPGAGTFDTTSNLSIGLTGLIPATSYTARVSQVCGSAVGDTSYSSAVTFVTPCATFTAPFTEDFAGTATPLCWSQAAATGGPWVFAGNPGYLAGGTVSNTPDGSSFAWVDFSGTDNDVELELPNVDVSGLSQPNLDFWFKSVPTTNQAINVLRIETYDGTNWNLIGTIQQDSPDWEFHSYVLSSSIYSTSLVKVRFVADPDPAGGTFFYNDLMLDDIRIDEAPSCITIDNGTLAASNVLAYSATISWDTVVSPQYFLIEYGVTGFLQGTGTFDTTSNLSINLINLTSATNYTVFISQVCGSAVGDTSYSSSVAFTTPCATFIAPFSENFAGAATPLCWSQAAATGGPWVFAGNPGYLAGGTGSHTADGSYYAWMDFSGTDNDVELELPNVDISALSQPFLQFWFKSVPTANQANNVLRVETYDGTDWNLIGTIQQDSPDWEFHSYDLTSSTYSTNLVKVRFVADPDPAGGTFFYNDLMLDDIEIDEPPAFDAQGTDFLAPVIGGCNVLTNAEIVTVEVSNVGSDTITSALVKLFINGTQVATGTYNGIILPGGSVPYTFPNGVNLSAAGQKIIRISASALPNEDVPWNDETIIVKFNDGNSLVSSYPYTQSFDTWNTCISNCIDNGCGTFGQTSGWRNQVGSDDSDWSVQTGATATGGTGPGADHTSGTGNYLYTEAGGCNDFELLSPCFDLGSLQFPELSFYYHMNGSNVGTLTVEADTVGLGNYVTVWTLSGTQGNNWVKATVGLTPFSGYVTKLRFKVTMGNGTSSDIAIDDILLRDVPPHDLQVTSILGPNDGCGDENVYIDVTVFNYGSTSESDYTVTVSQTGLTTNSISVLGTVILAMEDSTVVSVGPFTTAAGDVVNYAVDVMINNATDFVPTNNGGTYEHKAYALSFPQAVDGSRCGFGEVDLGATGVATEFFWYEDSLASSFIGTGSSFTTSYLYEDATYWLEGRAPYTSFAGSEDNTVDEGGHYDYYPDGLKFDAYYDLTIESIQVYPLAPGDIVVNVEDNQGNLLHTTTYQHLTTATKITIPLEFDILVGTDYTINATGTNTELYRNKDNNNTIGLAYPYELDNAMSITGPINNLMNSYYFFYNWEVTYLGCPSDRIPVQAIVAPSGLTPTFDVDDESLPGNGAISTTIAGGAAPYSFNWSNGLTVADIAGLNAGVYYVTISDANGCTDTFSTEIFYTVGTEEIASISDLSIFPNPSNGQFNVSIELDGIHEVSIEIVNTLGQVIYRTSPESIAARQYPMNLEDVPSGLYQIRINVDSESLTRTIMISTRK